MVNNILLVACAMRSEADIFLSNMNIVKENQIGNFKFYEGVCDSVKIVVLVSLPGIINMASGLSIGIRCYNPRIVLNYGVVGGIGDNIHQGDIVVCSDCMNLGSYMTSRLNKGSGVDINNWKFMTFTDNGVDELVLWKTDDLLLNLVSKFRKKYDKGEVLFGRIGSSDVWDKEYDKLLMFRNKYNIICEDMECISVYQVSGMFDVSCISIKVVSDNAIIGEEYDSSVLDKSGDFILFILEKLCFYLNNKV